MENKLEKIFEKNPPGVLISSSCYEDLESTCLKWSAKILGEENVLVSPDLTIVRPGNKMRQIGVENIRELNHSVYRSPLKSNRKVAILHEADRLNLSAANAFLKTLEEPPENTTIFLLTLHPYELPATVRSRCWWVNLTGSVLKSAENVQWSAWLSDFSQWLNRVLERKTVFSEAILEAYGLLYRFHCLRITIVEAALKEEPSAKVSLSEEELIALKSGTEKQWTEKLFTSIEEAMRNVLAKTKQWSTSFRFVEAIAYLEHVYKLTEVNLNEDVALEAFFFNVLQCCHLAK